MYVTIAELRYEVAAGFSVYRSPAVVKSGARDHRDGPLRAIDYGKGSDQAAVAWS